MNGPHDMGGFTGFGPVAPERNEPLFHEPWEARAMALSVAMGATGTWNIDMSRHARERREATDYWQASYYDKWIYGLDRLLVECGLVTAEELATGKSAGPAKPLKRKLTADILQAVLAKGAPADRPATGRPRFRVGDTVRARNITPSGHTRLPRYARGHAGVIVIDHGTHVLPDSNAHGKGENPERLYTVRFTAAELWGTNNTDTVNIDLWESYLEPRA